MIFRQLLDPETSTYTYLVADESTAQAALIDGVLEQLERDRTLIEELGLELRWALETHVHADHVTSSGRLRQLLGAEVAVGTAAGVANADRELADGETLSVGKLELETRHTPGHTAGCVTYVCHDAGIAFTGDALLVRGCGRTDFQQGDAATLYRSVHEQILTLPPETLLYPGHDYKGRTVTTVAEERRWNPRLGDARSETDFVGIMRALDLAYPQRMAIAVPANLQSGLRVDYEPVPGTPSVASVIERRGRQDAEMSMGMGI